MTPRRNSAEGETRLDTGATDVPTGAMRGARWKAALTALLLLLTGAALGIAADRLWLTGPSEAGAAPLTVDAMARFLDLSPADRARVQRLLDSLEVEVAAASRAGPDSLRTVARRARTRLEDALPAGARSEFHQWMQSHHQRMMERMHGPGGMPMHRDGAMPMHRDGMVPMHREDGGMMRPDTLPRRH